MALLPSRFFAYYSVQRSLRNYMTCESRPPVCQKSTGMFGVKRAFDKLKKIREMFWSRRPDLNRGPPAPKSGVRSLGSPSFPMFVLKTNELQKYLVVARCTEMWLRMYRVPRIFPIAKKQRKCSDRFR